MTAKEFGELYSKLPLEDQRKVDMKIAELWEIQQSTQEDREA